MVKERERRRCRERLHGLAGARLDSEEVRLEAIAQLQRTIGFDRWCWPLADPQALIPLSGLAAHDYGPSVPRVLELEFSGDAAAMDVVARRPLPAAALSGETRGDLARSPRWDEVLRAVGIGDEAVLACRDSLGCWGWLKAYRDGSDEPFADDELTLLAEVAEALGVALRRALGRDDRPGAMVSAAAGVVVLDTDLRPLSATTAAAAWIEALPGAALYAALGMLPAMVYPAATKARGHPDGAEGVLERTVDGRWVLIEAARLEGRGAGAIAVTFRDATLAETFDRLARIHALTRRERDVVAGVVAGQNTSGIARHLAISGHTVQDHLKAVFAKVGVRSRRELAARFCVPATAGTDF